MNELPYAYDRQGKPITGAEYDALRYREYQEVVQTTIEQLDRDVRISTVWLGTDHNYEPEGPPLIFETMVFGMDVGESYWRYATEAEARVGHEQVARWVQSECDPPAGGRLIWP